MRVIVNEKLKFSPEAIFAALTDIPHHTDWLEEPVELVKLIDGPAKLGTQWEQKSQRLGKNIISVNTCNRYKINREFGWVAEKPFLAQVTFLLESIGDQTNLTWMIESAQVGIVQLVEPLLVKQTNAMIRKSLARLKIFLQARMQ